MPAGNAAVLNLKIEGNITDLVLEVDGMVGKLLEKTCDFGKAGKIYHLVHKA